MYIFVYIYFVNNKQEKINVHLFDAAKPFETKRKYFSDNLRLAENILFPIPIL